MAKTFLTAVASLLLVMAELGTAYAAPAGRPVVTVSTVGVPIPARADYSAVHHIGGVAFVVPSDLLQAPDTLINGLPPEPAEAG